MLRAVSSLARVFLRNRDGVVLDFGANTWTHLAGWLQGVLVHDQRLATIRIGPRRYHFLAGIDDKIGVVADFRLHLGRVLRLFGVGRRHCLDIQMVASHGVVDRLQFTCLLLAK